MFNFFVDNGARPKLDYTVDKEMGHHEINFSTKMLKASNCKRVFTQFYQFNTQHFFSDELFHHIVQEVRYYLLNLLLKNPQIVYCLHMLNHVASVECRLEMYHERKKKTKHFFRDLLNRKYADNRYWSQWNTNEFFYPGDPFFFMTLNASTASKRAVFVGGHRDCIHLDDKTYVPTCF